MNNIVEDCYRLNGWTRYCPRSMLYLTLFTKSLTLLCIAYTLIRVYGAEYDADYPMPNTMSATDYKPAWHGVEYYLAVAMLADAFYVWGDIIDSGYNLYAYYTYDDWNLLDSISIAFGIIWGLFRLLPDQISAARVVLAIMAVPWSIGLLRFFSMSRNLGELVITFRMVYKDLKGFLAVYLVTCLGFVIALYGLFTNSNPFDSVSQTILYLFESTLGGFDFTVFPASSSLVNGIGVVASVIFVILTYVLLFNLLIALMFCTYDQVRKDGYMEWSYSKARMIRKLLIVKERHVYRMLPAPLNVIPIVCTVMGKFAYKECESTVGEGGGNRPEIRSHSVRGGGDDGKYTLRSTKRRNNNRSKSRRGGKEDTMNIMLVEQLLPNAHFRSSGGSDKGSLDGSMVGDDKEGIKVGKRLYSVAGRLSDCVVNIVLGFPLRCLDASYIAYFYIYDLCMQSTIASILICMLLSPLLSVYILAKSVYGSVFVLLCYLSGQSAQVVVREQDGVVVERGISQSDDKLM
ncbi:hypothetical protein EON65_40695 [archaeon]|nr:MAG: hypothetical protein EON65_40695 [archaeon]